MGGCWGMRSHLLLLAHANCPALRDLCTDSDMSSRMMPEPTLVTPWTAGAACVAMIRLIAFISSGCQKLLFFSFSIVLLKR